MTSRFSAPTTVDEAVAILAADPDARPVAGGTDLVVAARQGRKALPEAIVAIDRISELSGARVGDDGALALGALTSHAWLAAAREVREGWTALADAAAIVGSPATRSTGTIGGNLMNASPAADTIAPLVVFDAVATLAGRDGARRRVAVAELAVAPGRTAARAGELLVDVAVPAPGARSGSAYIRLEYRRAMEIAVVGAAVVVTVDGSGPDAARITDARVALTAVAPTIVASPGAASALAGSAGDARGCRAAGVAAAAEAMPIDDVRASADYRRAMIEVVVARAARAAVIRATGGPVPVPASRWAHGQAV
jgi:CO/xanthine dehydrogenase FAD-binding subunit